MNVEVVVPSKDRPWTVKSLSKIFPTAKWCISETEAKTFPHKNLLIHPDNVVGIGRVRQWILNAMPSKTVFMVDDDVTGLWSNVGHLGRRISGPDDIMRIIENAAEIAAGSGELSKASGDCKKQMGKMDGMEADEKDIQTKRIGSTKTDSRNLTLEFPSRICYN